MPFHLCSSSFILRLLSPLLYSTLQAKLHFGTRKGASLAALRAMKPRVSCHFPRFSPPPTATNVTNISSNCECGRRYWPVPSFLIYIYIYISSIVDCSTSTPPTFITWIRSFRLVSLHCVRTSCSTRTTMPHPGRRQTDLCGLGFKQTLTDKKYWSLNRDAVPGSSLDIYKHNPWRAPGAAPVSDACGLAGTHSLAAG